MTEKFQSRFKKHIIGFLEQKRALGRIYFTEEGYLKSFDSFCITNYPLESTLTKNIVLKWSEARENESPKGLCSRISPIRELAKYMNSIGADSYVIPRHLFPRTSRYVPHLYTSEELSAIFSVLDQLQFNNRFPIRHLVIPVMFRMIYCCGLRPKEGRNILRQNVDLKTGKMIIQETKNHKDRVVILSTDILKLCQQYDKKIDAIFPERLYFFPNSDWNT